MIESVQFGNFKALRGATIKLAPFTLILGPNGSGKSTVFEAIRALAEMRNLDIARTASVGIDLSNPATAIEVSVVWGKQFYSAKTTVSWLAGRPSAARVHDFSDNLNPNAAYVTRPKIDQELTRFRFFSLDAATIAQPATIQPGIELAPNGSQLAAVLELLRESALERFEALNAEVSRWLPEYERIQLPTVSSGVKGIALRTRHGRHDIPADQLSQGTLLALAMLTLAYLPNPPAFVGLEEPDRGIHPRLLRELQDALYRLAYPDSCGEKRPAVQVVVTSHSPYLLDLYRDHPEEVVLAQKEGPDVYFTRLTDKPDFKEILGDAPLSEVWYSGVLGGVPTRS